MAVGDQDRTEYRIEMTAGVDAATRTVLTALQAIERGAREAAAALSGMAKAPGGAPAAQAAAAASTAQAGALQKVAAAATAATAATVAGVQPTRTLATAQTAAAAAATAQAAATGTARNALGQFVAQTRGTASATNAVANAVAGVVTPAQRLGGVFAGLSAGTALLQGRMGRLWDLLGRGALLWQGLLLPITGVAAAAAGVGAAFRGPAGLEEAMFGVAKVTDFTAAQLAEIRQEFLLMARDPSMRRSAEGMAAIGQAAGQLGIKGREDLLAFTKTVALLEQTTDLVAEEAAFSLARLLQVTGTAREDVDRIGSALVTLGNNVAATEAEITRNALRVGQATALFEIGAPRVLAYGAALREMGAEAEISSGVLGRAFIAIQESVSRGGEKLEGFAEAAGLSAEEFAAAWATNPAQAFETFLAGLQQQGDRAIETLGRLGLGGSENLRILPLLAQNYGRLTQIIRLSTEGWEENAAAQTEAARRAESTFSRIAALIATIRAAFDTLQAGLPAIKEAIDTINAVVANLAGLPPVVEANTVAVEALTVAFVALGAAASAALLQFSAGALLRFVGGVGTARVALLGLGYLMRGEFALALRVAQYGVVALWTVIRAHPFVAIVTAVTVLVYALRRVGAAIADMEVTVGGRATRIGDIVRATFEVVGGDVANFFGWLYDRWVSVNNALLAAGSAALRLFFGNVRTFANAMLGLITGDGLLGKLLRSILSFGDFALAALQTVIDAVGILVKGVFNAVTALGKLDFSGPRALAASAGLVLAEFAKIGGDAGTDFASAFNENMEKRMVSGAVKTGLGVAASLTNVLEDLADKGVFNALDIILPGNMGSRIEDRIREIQLERVLGENLARSREIVTGIVDTLTQVPIPVRTAEEFAADASGERTRAAEESHRVRMLELRRLDASFAEGEEARLEERRSLELRHLDEMLELREQLVARKLTEEEIAANGEVRALRAAQEAEAAGLRHEQTLQRAAELRERDAKAQEVLNDALERTENQLKAGTITRGEAFSRARAAAEAYKRSLTDVRAELQKLIDKAADPETRAALERILGEVGEGTAEAQEHIRTFADSLAEGIERPLEGAFATYIQTLGDARAALSSFLNDIASELTRFAARGLARSLMEGLFGGTEEGGGGRSGGLLGGFVNGVGGFFGGIFGRRGTVEGDLGPASAANAPPSGFWEGIRGGFGRIMSGIGSGFTALIGGIGSGFGAVLSGLGSILSSIIGGIGTGVSTFFGALGKLPGFAAGGPVPGRVLAAVGPGELIVGPSAASRIGSALLGAVNRAASGGSGILDAIAARAGIGAADVGIVPGNGPSGVDDRLAALRPGSYVLRAAAVSRFGAGRLAAALAGIGSLPVPAAAELLRLPELPRMQLPGYAGGGPVMPGAPYPGAGGMRGGSPGFAVVVPDKRQADRWYAGGDGALAEEIARRNNVYQRALLGRGINDYGF
jgi:TP901 family phage tail tape measure protein